MGCPLEKVGLEPYGHTGKEVLGCRECRFEFQCYNPDESKRPKDISELKI